MVGPKPYHFFCKHSFFPPVYPRSFSQLCSFQCTYGTTEVPLILTSARDSRTPSSAFMRPIDSRSIAFVPISSSGTPSSVYKNVNANVLELLISAASPDCPHHSMRQPEDGHFHTGDLFLEVVPGRYTFRGRIAEWVKSSTGLLYDAKYVRLPPPPPFAPFCKPFAHLR